MEWWRLRAIQVLGADMKIELKVKTFKPKNNLPRLANYNVDPGEEFWEIFPTNHKEVGQTLISGTKLLGLAKAVGYRKMDMVAKVVRDTREGADIGCKGEARNRTVSTNAKSCFEYPEHITDAIATWLRKGFAAGPYREEEVPAEAKINGIMCRPKPDGSVRVILNLSAPKGSSVNDGINSDDFPTSMSSTREWIQCLNRAGRGALITKIDWEAAYKHIHVRPEDLHLQWFKWLDRYFVELCLIFGSASSPGIYDRAAKVVLDMVLAISKFPRNMAIQYLDDVCATCPAGQGDSLDRFRKAYRDVANQVGVKLASEDDPEKAFAPSTQGVVLGVQYDTQQWTWEIPEDKMHRLVAKIREMMGMEEMKQHEIWKTVGRIIHYEPLIPCGKYNIRHLIKLNNVSRDKDHMVVISPQAKRQLWFWEAVLRVSSGVACIPYWPAACPGFAREFYTDAAGGSCTESGLGCGGVSEGWWFYQPWGEKINTGAEHEGKKLCHKMSALELVGPLVCMTANPELVRAQAVRILVDNIGSVEIWKKGYSNVCGLSSTIVTALATVAASLGTQLFIEKVTRCSNEGATMADLLSKGKLTRFRSMAEATGWTLPVLPARVPKTVLAWVADPREDDNLGEEILNEMKLSSLVLGYNC
ncbi:MAG: hypothetical protein FJ333_08890 [Sphingomonadales bacterium]|nr:hypothetical protein [Sphingomonadales bacterium]